MKRKPTKQKDQVALSVAAAKLKIITSTYGATKALDLLMKKSPRGHLSDADSDEVIFGAFLMFGPDVSKHPTFREFIRERSLTALAAGDGNFFIRLGRAMKANPNVSEGKLPDKVDMLLVMGWLPKAGQKFGLCDFTDSALTDFCIIALNDENLTEDSVCKRRQRLGLKKPRKPSINGVKVANRKGGYSITQLLVDKSAH